MKIIVITITCNRLEESKQWLHELRDKAGLDYYHIVVDNGSDDGTLTWLENDFKPDLILKLKKNHGVIRAWLVGIKKALELGADFIVKFDNDCEINEPDILKKLMEWYKRGCDNYVIAPLDTEILPNYLPKVLSEVKERGFKVRYTTHTGGIFQILPKKAAQLLLDYPNIEKINGDLKRGGYWISQGISPIYLTEITISHRGIENQTNNYIL